MLLTLLILSIAFTMACVVAEGRTQAPVTQKPTPVVVEMQEDNDFDEDPPTVVGEPRPVISITEVTGHRITTGIWGMVAPSIRPQFLRLAQFLTWLASL